MPTVMPAASRPKVAPGKAVNPKAGSTYGSANSSTTSPARRSGRPIKYVKAWAALKFDLNNGRPSSILLTVLVAEAAKSLGNSGLSADDETLRGILEIIVERLEDDAEVPIPSTPRKTWRA